MLSQLFSLIYRLSCRTTLIEIGVHGSPADRAQVRPEWLTE